MDAFAFLVTWNWKPKPKKQHKAFWDWCSLVLVISCISYQMSKEEICKSDHDHFMQNTFDGWNLQFLWDLITTELSSARSSCWTLFFFFSAEGHEMPKGARYPCNNSVFSKRPDCGGRVRLKLVSHLGLLLNSLVSVGRQHQPELLWKLCRVGHIRWWQHGSQDSSTDSLLFPIRGTSGKVWRPPSPSDSSSWADERPCEARSSPD